MNEGMNELDDFGNDPRNKYDNNYAGIVKKTTVLAKELLEGNQWRTGIKTLPGQFPDDLPPCGPSPGKIVKDSRNHLFPM